jgi:hypothetical protein
MKPDRVNPVAVPSQRGDACHSTAIRVQQPQLGGLVPAASRKIRRRWMKRDCNATVVNGFEKHGHMKPQGERKLARGNVKTKSMVLVDANGCLRQDNEVQTKLKKKSGQSGEYATERDDSARSLK